MVAEIIVTDLVELSLSSRRQVRCTVCSSATACRAAMGKAKKVLPEQYEGTLTTSETPLNLFHFRRFSASSAL